MNSSLELFFFYLYSKQVKKFKLSFRENIEDIEKDKHSIPIPDTVFKHGKDKITVNITLYNESEKSEKYHFNLYYGKNYAYVQLDGLSKRVYEIILQKMKNVKITVFGKEFKELDNFGNKIRTRLTLINYYFGNIQINEKEIDLTAIVSQNSIESEITFNQISILDFESNKYIIQPIKEKSEYNVKFLKDKKTLILNFENNFNSFLKSDISNYKSFGEEIKKKYQIIKNHGSLNLNRDDAYLNEIFNKNTFLNLELFYNYSLCIFFLDNSLEYIYLNKYVVLGLIKIINQIKDEINEKEELPMYEKVRIIYTLFTVIFMTNKTFRNAYELSKLNVRYLITNEKKKNSIMDRCYNFYNSFIDSINEDSAIFPYLLNIDSGCGYYNQDTVYTFDLKNVDMIKSHLRQVFPKIIILCYVENGEVALTESEFGGIIINEFYLTKLMKPKINMIIYEYN